VTSAGSSLDASASILIIDDAADNLFVLNELLRADYRVLAANSGPAGLRAARQLPAVDLILIDLMMPELDGYAVLARLRADPLTRDIPVIFLTALVDDNDEERGLALGAADFISKPLKPAVVLARVRTQIHAKRARDWLRDENAALEAEVARRMVENEQTQRVAIRALAHLAEARDPETGNHILRTQAYVERLARGLRDHSRFTAFRSERLVELLTRSAPLHDIGKVAIPDAVLQKPGPLNAEEWAVMQTHARRGSQAIEQAERDIEQPLAFLSVAKEIACWHHEQWDGSGYPDGLAGEAIPASARLMAVADVFDALISKRAYKPAMSCAEAGAIIVGQRGSHFDPDVVDAFQAGYDDFEAIAGRYREAGR